ncbi:MAG: class I SAM-dependent rRNA methyltransferase [Chloroflexales bacterium]|nr:class I SAM-dependent rRNA methyltransferase [Chloroflexales bacterium]
MPRAEITLPRNLRDTLRRGHPWVYRNHLDAAIDLADGTEVVVRCGGWRGIGLWDAQGPIAIRIYTTANRIDASLITQRVREAWQGRSILRAQGVTAYRWLFGEGDGLPGITVDLYGNVAVLQSYGSGPASIVHHVVVALVAVNPDLVAVLGSKNRDDDNNTSQRRAVLWGEVPAHELVVQEHAGLQFVVDPQVGQKTGLFLDHRENRQTLMHYVAGLSVLNCFAYTGAFSLYALKGGARKVVSADSGHGLAEAAERNIALNQLPAERHQYVTQDCFELLQKMTGDGRKYDCIILDPPSFARTRLQRDAAMQAYTRLNMLAIKCLTPNGLLVSASCTSQIAPEEFRMMLTSVATNSEKRLQILHEAGHALDHPVPAHFLEGRYLKFIIARIGDLW